MTKPHPIFAEALAPSAPPPVNAERFSRAAFEAFSLDRRTRLLDPLEATSLDDALAEATCRWAWDRGDRLAVREIVDEVDRLHIFAVRRASTGTRVWKGHTPTTEHRRWLDPVCIVDLNVINGVAVGLVGCEVELHRRRQSERPCSPASDRAR